MLAAVAQDDDAAADTTATPSPAAPRTPPKPGAAPAPLAQALFDPAQPGSVVASLRQVLRLAALVRDRLSPDSWRIYNRLSEFATAPEHTPRLGDALQRLDESLLSLVTLSGFVIESMPRDAGWRFLSIGRRIERLQFLAAALSALLLEPSQGGLKVLLAITDAELRYRSRHARGLAPQPVAELVMLDGDNPRALRYQLDSLAEHVALQLQQEAGHDLRRGKTRGVRGKPGHYNVIFGYQDEGVGMAAGQLAVRLVNDLVQHSEDFDWEQELESFLRRAERTAFNAVIQGTAADLMKQAMARIRGRIRAGGLAATLVLQGAVMPPPLETWDELRPGGAVSRYSRVTMAAGGGGTGRRQAASGSSLR